MSSDNSEAGPSVLTYTPNEKVLCYQGPLIWEAKVKEAKVFGKDDSKTGAIGPHYKVHYHGWAAKWDEWVPPSRMLKHTPENLERQAAIKRELNKSKEEPPEEEEKDHQQQQQQAKKAASPQRAAGVPASSSRRKRTKAEADEDVPSRRPELKLQIPDTLKVKLVNDWENVTKHSRLVSLPRKPNVREILDEYRAFKTTTPGTATGTGASKPTMSRQDAVLAEVTSGLVVYFDAAIGHNLLYRFERKQYKDQDDKLKAKEGGLKPGMSQVYGAEHLLRLFVNLPLYVNAANMDAESLDIIKTHVNDILKWMTSNEKRLFLDEYENTSTVYQNKTRA